MTTPPVPAPRRGGSMPNRKGREMSDCKVTPTSVSPTGLQMFATGDVIRQVPVHTAEPITLDLDGRRLVSINDEKIGDDGAMIELAQITFDMGNIETPQVELHVWVGGGLIAIVLGDSNWFGNPRFAVREV